MLDRILKVEKKVRRSVVRIENKNLTWAPVIVWKRKNPSPFRSCLECSHKMEMKYSEKGTLVQRRARSTCTRGQPPSKLRSAVAHAVKNPQT